MNKRLDWKEMESAKEGRMLGEKTMLAIHPGAVPVDGVTFYFCDPYSRQVLTAST